MPKSPYLLPGTVTPFVTPVKSRSLPDKHSEPLLLTLPILLVFEAADSFKKMKLLEFSTFEILQN